MLPVSRSPAPSPAHIAYVHIQRAQSSWFMPLTRSLQVSLHPPGLPRILTSSPKVTLQGCLHRHGHTRTEASTLHFDPQTLNFAEETRQVLDGDDAQHRAASYTHLIQRNIYKSCVQDSNHSNKNDFEDVHEF